MGIDATAIVQASAWVKPSDESASLLAEHPATSLLRQKFGAAIIALVTFRGETTILVDRHYIVEILTFLRDEPTLTFTSLADIACCDWLGHEPRFEISYHLLSMARRDRLRIKVGVPESNLELPSVTAVWLGANWFEREIFDLFGLTFVGHPDLRRILLPDDWVGYPLRRDEAIGGEEVAFTS